MALLAREERVQQDRGLLMALVRFFGPEVFQHAIPVTLHRLNWTDNLESLLDVSCEG